MIGLKAQSRLQALTPGDVLGPPPQTRPLSRDTDQQAAPGIGPAFCCGLGVRIAGRVRDQRPGLLSDQADKAEFARARGTGPDLGQPREMLVELPQPSRLIGDEAA